MGEQQRSRAYPKHWEADVVLRDGAAAQLRPVRAEDSERLQRMHASQSESSIYLRYFSYKPQLSEADLARYIDIDFHDRVSFAVLLNEEIIAVGGYDRIDATTEAEVSFFVADAHQGRGLGSILLEHLAAAARERDLELFSAEVLPQNRKMINVFSEAGYEISRSFEDDVIMVQFPIDPTDKSREVMESREHRAEARSVRALLSPDSVAVVGVGAASPVHGDLGHHLVKNLQAGGFTGEIHVVEEAAYQCAGEQGTGESGVRELGAVDSSLAESSAGASDADVSASGESSRVESGFQGSNAHDLSLTEREVAVDLAVITVAPELLEHAVTDCGRAGVKGLLVLTEPADSLQQRQLIGLARRWGMRVIGPASAGVINTDSQVRLNATITPDMPLAGAVGLFSQSSAVGVSLIAQAHRRNLGITAAISAGNRADLSGNDAMQYFEDDQATGALGVYLESFGNPRKFFRIAHRVALSKPVVVATADVMGQRLPPGHQVRDTQVSPDAVDAMLENSGVIQVGDHDALMDVLQVVATQPLPQGNRLGILTNAPSMSRVLADAAERYDLQVVRENTELRLDADPASASQAVADALAAQFRDENVDVVAVCLQPHVTGEQPDVLDAMQDVAQQFSKPLVVSPIGIRTADVPLNFIARPGSVAHDEALQPGLAVFNSPGRSVAALGRIARYARWRTESLGEPLIPAGLEGPKVAKAGEALLSSWLAEHQGAELLRLDQDQTAELLSLYGVPLLPTLVAKNADDAVTAAEQIGYPVAVKSTNAYLRHRLDLGGADLHIADEPMLRQAVAQMQQRLAAYGVAELQVQAMAPEGQGCIVRAIEDSMMGPVISFGISGDAVDLLDDWAYAVPPMTDKDLWRLLHGPRAARKLFGYQGVPAVDADALADAVQRVATLKDNHPQVAALELSPLLASPSGARVLHATVDIANPQARTDSARRALSRY